MKIVCSLYTMLSGGFNFKSNKRFDSLSWSLFVSYLYTRRGYIIGELNEEQKQYWKLQKKKSHTPFFPSGFSSFIRLLRVSWIFKGTIYSLGLLFILVLNIEKRHEEEIDCRGCRYTFHNIVPVVCIKLFCMDLLYFFLFGIIFSFQKVTL